MAMAEKLLAETQEYDVDDPDGPPPKQYWERKQIGKQLRLYLDKRITELAETMVRERFDEVIHERIAAAVDEVLRDGWVKTDEYGDRNGEVIDLKGRISRELLQQTGD